MTPRRERTEQVPNPGSDEAIAKGCSSSELEDTCPVLDNAHGKGYLGGVREDCPLHGHLRHGKTQG